MKRALVPALFVCSVLYLPRAFAQQQTSAPGSSASRPLKWETVDKIQILKAWQADPPDTYPQIAVLRLSSDDYLKFLQNPSALVQFANKAKIFPADVRKVGPWSTLSNLSSADPPDFVVTLLHQHTSMMVVGGIQEPVEGP